MAKKKSNKITAEDLEVLYDLAWTQFREDRAAATGSYEHLKSVLIDSPHMYPETGDILAKYTDLMIKQTGQVVDLIKLAQKSAGEDVGLSEEDMMAIHDAIKEDDEEEGEG
jgi:hypothetical protein